MAIDFQPEDDKIDFQLDFQEDKPGEKSFAAKAWDAYKGAMEAEASLLTGTVAPFVGIAGGAINALNNVASGRDADFRNTAENIAEKLTYSPKTESGQSIMDTLEPLLTGMQALGPAGYHVPVHAAPALNMAAAKFAKGAKPREVEIPVAKTETPPKIEFVPDQAAMEKLALGDEQGQMALFDQGDQMGQRNQFNAGNLGDWRIDENGMPVRIDKSMEAANVEAPLQRNLWGDELPTNGLEGRDIGITQAIDNTTNNWAARKGMINRLGGKGNPLEPGNDLLAAMQEADGMKLPFEENTTFQPTNPLPTETLGEVMRRTESQTPNAATVLPIGDRPTPIDSVQTPRSPATIAERAQQRQVAARVMSKDPRLAEFEPVRTKEEALSMAEADGFKDNAPGVIGRNLGSGANWAAINTNNPVIKFVNTAFRDARVAAENFSKKYVTASDGLSPTWAKLDSEMRNRVRETLLEGDRYQVRVNDEAMIKAGMTELERNFVNKYYEANEAMFQRWNQVLAEQGLKPVDRREGHVPGIFKGAYKALVTDEKGVTGVIAADSKYELAAAKKYFAEKHPNWTVTEQGRKGLADYKNQSDIFSGMNDILTLLAEKDPKFAEVQATVNEAIKHGNNSIYAFNKHELSKKGVLGNEGNKPWLNANKNTEAWFKAMVQYFEEGAQHHELQGPLADARTLANDLADKMPKTAKFVDSYTKHVTGQNANNPIAAGVNAVIDMPSKLLGFGPRASLQAAGMLKNRMSQIFMGFGNWVFTAAQLAQPMQTGFPVLTMATQRLGNAAYAPKAMWNGGQASLLLGLERMTGKNFGDKVPSHMREAWKYAEDRGLMNFSEMEKAYEGQKSKFGRGFDKVAEMNMKVGELGTRTPMFLSFVDALVDGGVPAERAMPIAENMTQLAMIDYHQWERPQLYSKMGTIGQFAGGLTTFKHGYVGQQIPLMKEALRGNATPALASAAAMVAFAGITGAPFYDEADQLFGYLTNKINNKRQTIADTVLKNVPEWIKSGLISNATNVSVQSKFSSANMVPDTVPQALSPQLSALGNGLVAAVDIAKYGDKQAWANMLMNLAPSTFKGVVEDQLLKNDKGQVLNKQMQATVDRSPEDWELRKWTGLRPHKEVIQREHDFKARMAEQADTEAKKQISQEFKRGVMNDKPPIEKLKEYQERGGDPKSLMQIFQDAAKERNMTEEQRRAAGLKSTPGSMRKQEYYNKPGER